jgi:hypothetical protein
MPDKLSKLAPLILAVIQKNTSAEEKARQIIHILADQKRQEIYRELGVPLDTSPRWVPKI